MKRIIVFLLVLSLILCGCTSEDNSNYDNQSHISPNTDKSSETILPTNIDINSQSNTQNTDITPTTELETTQIVEPTGVVEPTLVDVSAFENEDDVVTIDSSLNNGPPIFQHAIENYTGLNDPDLLQFIENEIAFEIDTDKYTVDNISVTYLSKAYIRELSYNTKSNVVFGYNIEELDKLFQGKKYIFTLEDGETVVKEFEAYDNTFDQIIKNVAIGTGVILICVTISAVSGGLGAPAVSAIFYASAKSATEFALSSAVINSAITAAVTGIETKDFEKTMKAALLSGSEGFKMGAIFGAAAGGAIEAVTLKVATGGGMPVEDVLTILNDHKDLPARFLKELKNLEEFEKWVAEAKRLNITIEELVKIHMATKYPLEIVKCFKTLEENAIYYEEAGLYIQKVNNSLALVRDIDLNFKTVTPKGRVMTNLERMKEGYAAIDPLTGKAYQLHHIGQSVDSPLAILTNEEHLSSKNYSILHNVNITPGTGVHSLDPTWDTKRAAFWKAYAKLFENGGFK